MYGKCDHIPIIIEIAKGMNIAGFNDCYLELGISKAKCFNPVSKFFKNSIAVDINDCSRYIDNKSTTVYIGTTDYFFDENRDTFNMIFIDAEHSWNQVKSDFVNSMKILKQNGVIILHDTFPPNKESFIHCKDGYKIMKEFNYCTITLPFYYGLTIYSRPEVVI